jgi:hypothetical protein
MRWVVLVAALATVNALVALVWVWPSGIDLHTEEKALGAVSGTLRVDGSPEPVRNAGDERLAAVTPVNREASCNNSSASLVAQGGFVTKYVKIRCGAMVTNLCFASGQPRYFTPPAWPPGRLLTRSGATTVCNEAVTKPKLHMVLYSAPPPGGELPWPAAPNHVMLVAPFCWELYGYHLILCLQAAFAQLLRLGFTWSDEGEIVDRSSGDFFNDDNTSSACRRRAGAPPRLVFAVHKGSGLFPYLLGSSSSWLDPNPTLHHPNAPGILKHSKPQAAAYWHLWRTLADDPADVYASPDVPSACYRRALLGGLPSTDVLPHEAQEFSRVMLKRLRGVRRHIPSCLQLRVVLIQRAVRYRILNLERVVEDISSELQRAVEGASVAVRVVSFENMSVVAQVDIAANADVLVGVHGNGLSWSVAMPSGSAIVELWPNRAYNRNYVDFALRHNLAYFSVESRSDGCRARCPAEYDLRKSGVLQRVAAHWHHVVCRGGRFNTSAEFYALRLAAAQRKRTTKG